MQYNLKWKFYFILLFCFFQTLNAYNGNGSFKVYEIDVQESYEKYLLEDLNSDDLKDIVVLKKKEWLIYLQTFKSLPLKPDQHFQPDSMMLAFDFGNVDGKPGNELVYFTGNGVYYYKIENGRIHEKPIRLFQPESVFYYFAAEDDPEVFKWDFVQDFNGDGNDDILVPMLENYALYTRGENGKYHSMIEFEGGTNTSISGGKTVSGRYSTKEFLFEDFNRDGRKDIISIESTTLNVFFQNVSGSFPEKMSKAIDIPFAQDDKIVVNVGSGSDENEEEQAKLTNVIDLNGDGFLDLTALKVSTKESVMNPKSQIQIYLGKEDQNDPGTGCYYEEKPNHIIVSEGVQIETQILDLNGDKKLDLVIPTLKFGIFKIVKMLLTRSATMNVWFYTMNSDDSYSEEPDFKKDVTMKFDFGGGDSSPLFLADDLNGDGVNDLITGEDNEKIQVFFGGGEKLFSKDEDMSFEIEVPKDGEDRVKAGDINGDGKSDLIITYDKFDDKKKDTQNIIRILIAGE